MDVLAYLKEIGPFSAPLVVLMAAAGRWLLARLDAAETRERAAVAAKSDAEKQCAVALAQASTLIDHALGAHGEKLDELAEEVRILVSGSKRT